MIRHNLMDKNYFDKIGVATTYALEGVQGLPSDAILLASEDTWEDIKDKDFVAYRDHQDVIHVGSINFTEKNIILHNLSSGIPDKVLPRKEIKRCDWIHTIDFRDNALALEKASLNNLLGDLCPLQ